MSDNVVRVIGFGRRPDGDEVRTAWLFHPAQRDNP